MLHPSVLLYGDICGVSVGALDGLYVRPYGSIPSTCATFAPRQGIYHIKVHLGSRATLRVGHSLALSWIDGSIPLGVLLYGKLG